MKAVTDLVKRFQRGYADVVGVDIGTTSAKAVRLKLVNREVTVVAVDSLDTVVIPSEAAPASAPVPMVLPKAVRGRHVALAYSGAGAIVKLLTFPTHSEKTPSAMVLELMGIAESSQYRLAYESLSTTRAETRALAVAVPDVSASHLCALFPSGVPAPCSIEVSGLAGMTAFERGPGRHHLDEAVTVIDFGAAVSTVAFYNKGVPVMIRKFDFGIAAILKKVQESLGVDREVALGILSDGSFDVSQTLYQSMESFLQQLVISRDFVERRENCHMARLYAFGGAAPLKAWAQAITAAVGSEPVFWNPFDALAVLPDAVPAQFKGQEPRFAGALGAAMAVLSQG